MPELVRGDRRMTYGGDGEDYAADSRFLTFSAREFVRRLRYAITRQENRFIWFLGAGCSVSSGVPTASEVAHRWLKELIYLETGSEADLDAWAAKRFVGYDPDDLAAIYAELFEALFYTDADRRRELEELMKVAEPSFGYATLSQLMTHEKWGVRSNLALTVNFDDLAADALHLYSQRRPQVFTNESLGRRTTLSSASPTIVKLHGDAHLQEPELRGNRPELRSEVCDRLREQITEAGLIFIGYGGRDDSIVRMLEGLPVGAPACGVFWINEEPPQGELAAWMESRRTVWVRHSDFDELMYFMRLEFGLGHPKVDRFERGLRRYDAKYRELSTRAGLGLSETPAQTPAQASVGADKPERKSGERRLGLSAPAGVGSRKETEESRRERLRQSLNAFSKAIRPNRGGDGGESAAPAVPAAPAAAPNPTPDLTVRKTKLLDAAKLELRGAGRTQPPSEAQPAPAAPPTPKPAAAQAPSTVQAPASPPPSDDVTIDQMLSQLEEGSSIKIGGGDPGAAAPEPGRLEPVAIAKKSKEPARGRDISQYAATFKGMLSANASDRGRFPIAWIEQDGERLPMEPVGPATRTEAAEGDAALVAAIETSQAPAPLIARRARFLAIAARDLAGAEQAYEAAQQLAPDDIPLLRDYAKFAVEQLRDAGRAERLLTRALNLDLRNADTLRALADFLVRARGDLDEAENCYRLAIEVAPEHVDNRIAYARFLEERRWRRDAAEHQLREAAEVRPQSARAVAELALLRLGAGASIDQTAKQLETAAKIGPQDATVARALGALAERQGDLDSAEAEYRRAAELAPADVRAQLAFAEFLRARRGDPAAAEVQLRQIAAAAPDEGAPLSALAVHLEAHGGDPATDLTRAEQLHRDATDREPYNAAVRAAYAGFLGRLGDRVEEADALFQDALSLTTRDPEILRAYGRFLESAKRDPDAAETYLRRAVEVDPKGVEGMHDLARFLSDVRQDAEQAEVYYREALRLAPDRAETLNRFAAFLRDTRRDLEEAERCYRQAIAQNPKDATMLSRAAQFLLAEGRTDEGIKVLNDAFDAAYSMDPSVRPRWLMLELWIYRFAHDPARREDSARAARLLIEAGARSDGWDLGPTIERAVASGHPNPDFLRDLARVATDGADPSILDKYT